MKIVLADVADVAEVAGVAGRTQWPVRRMRTTVLIPKIAMKTIQLSSRVTTIRLPTTRKMMTLPRLAPSQWMRKAANNAGLGADADVDLDGRLKMRRLEPPNDPRTTRMTTGVRTVMRSATNRRPVRNESKKSHSHR